MSYMRVLRAAEEPVAEIEPVLYEKITLVPASAHRSPCYRPISSVGRGTLLRRAIRGNQLQSIDWVGSPWARRDPFR